MSFVQMAINKGVYTQHTFDQDKNNVNEFIQVENADGLIQFQDFDFDQNGAVDYRRSFSYTTNGKEMYEEFFTNSSENNEKIYKEKSTLDKILNFFSFATKTSTEDINKEEIRAKADELTQQYAKENNQAKQEKAEERAILETQLEEMQNKLNEAREKINEQLNTDLALEPKEKLKEQKISNPHIKFFN